jgi:hypothetical protein
MKNEEKTIYEPIYKPIEKLDWKDDDQQVRFCKGVERFHEMYEFIQLKPDIIDTIAEDFIIVEAKTGGVMCDKCIHHVIAKTLIKSIEYRMHEIRLNEGIGGAISELINILIHES